MKRILQFTTAQDLLDWDDEFLTVTDIDPDPTTGYNRAVVVGNLNIDADSKSVLINTVVYLLDPDGNPINGRVNSADKNIVPREVAVMATNNSFISLSTMEVITDLEGLQIGVDYLPEYEAYRLQAKGGPIDIFPLLTWAVQTSTKI